MSRAVAAVHGQFGRAVIYKLNRPFNIHAHREGHLIFHLSGDDGGVLVSGLPAERPTTPSSPSAHGSRITLSQDLDEGSTFFVLYVNPDWFASGQRDPLRFGRSEFARTPALDAQIRCVSALVYAGQRVTTLDCELRSLIQACYEETWRQMDLGEGRCLSGQAIDFRVRKSMRLMEEPLGATSSSTRWRAARACRVRISTNCFGRRPGSRQTSMSTPCSWSRRSRDLWAARFPSPISATIWVSLAKRLHALLRRQCGHGADAIPPGRPCPLAARRSGHEIILSIKRARPKADRLPERHYGRFGFAVTGEFTTTRLDAERAPRRARQSVGPARRAVDDQFVARRPIWSLIIAVLVIAAIWLVFAPWSSGFEAIFGRKKLFLNAVLNGITLGGLYFLVASGFTLIFGLMRNVNLAHGSIYLLGGYFGYLAVDATGSWLFGFVVAFIVAALLGVILQVAVFRRMEGRSSPDACDDRDFDRARRPHAMGIRGNSWQIQTPTWLRGPMDFR